MEGTFDTAHGILSLSVFKSSPIECSAWIRNYIRIVSDAGLILDLRPANERRRYIVTTFPIGWAQA